MKYLKYIVMYLLLTGSAQAGPYFGIGMGKNDIFNKNDWEGREDIGCMLELGWEWNPQHGVRLELGMDHYSQCDRGVPFDDRTEDTLDGAYFKVRWYH